MTTHPCGRRSLCALCLLLLLSLLIQARFSLSQAKSATQTPAQSSNAAKRTQIVLLGTGTPNADPDRFGPATAIVVNGTPYIIDFGPGVVRRAAAAARAGVSALVAKNLKTAFVT